MAMPTISVVIPTHQRRDLLRELLAALDRQTYDPNLVEVVVVLDGCTDGTFEMLNRLDARYVIRPVVRPQGGAAAARNSGAQAATRQLLVFLDDDLIPLPELLTQHASVHQRDADAVVLGRLLSPGRKYEAGRGGWNVWEARTLEKHYRAMAAGKRPPAGRRLYSGNFSLSRDRFLSVGGFDERLERFEDVDLGFRLERLGLRFHFNPRAASIHRGYRGFESWSRSAYLYGRCEAAIAAEKGPESLGEVLAWYPRQHVLLRMTLALLIGRPAWQGIAIQCLRLLAGALTRLRLYGIAHGGYTFIYRIRYWQGLVDERSSQGAFRRASDGQQPSSTVADWITPAGSAVRGGTGVQR